MSNSQVDPAGARARTFSSPHSSRRRRRALAPASLCVAFVSVAVAAASAGAASGWGAQAGYLGRYHVRPLASSSRSHFTSGELTLFMREVKKGKPLVPSGILNLRVSGGDTLVYLTYLSTSGATLQAKVNGGAFVGPVIGSFTGRRAGSNRIVAITFIRGLGNIDAAYERFSRTPAP